MKAFKGADFIKRTSSIDAVGNLHSELQACLADVPGASSAQDQLSDQRVVCDRVLRACNHWAGDSSCHGEHLQSLVPLAQLACRGFHASCPQRTPFYLEKILFHLMKNFSARESSFWACTQFSDLLYSFLFSSPADQQDLGDFTALSKSGFQLLWKAASDKEQKQTPCSYNRETLCLRLHSLRFLLLIECSASHEDSSLSVSRHTKSATLAFESKGKLCSQDDALFLSQTLEDLLVKPLVQHGIHSGPRARCLVELTLERCHKLCKSRCFKQGREAIKKAHEYLNGVEGCCQVGLALLDLALDFNELDRSFELEKLLSKGTDLVKAAFDSGDGWLCQALGECCQFAVSSLDGRLRHSVNAGKLGLHEVLSLAKFLELHSCLIEKQASMISKDATRQLRILKQQQYSGFQNFTSAVCSFLQRCKDTGCDGLELLLESCKHAISRVLSFLETLPDQDVTEFLTITASCVHNLAYWFFSQKRYQEASDLVSPLCERLAMKGCGPDPELAVERLHRCFKLHVESCRKAGQNTLGLAAVAHWLRALRAQVTKQMAEPIALWVRVKMDGVKNGDEELRLRTLKDELTQQPMDPELMVSLLAEELKGYKSVHGDTGQERYNTICDLLELCSEGSNLHHYRPPFLLELAQVLCYHDYREQTDCSALDAVEECLRLLESTSAELNNPLLLDTKAKALLWWYICTLEAKLQEGLEVQRRKAKDDTQQPWTGVEYEPNDLNYEDKLHDDLSVRDGICFTLAGEAGPMKSLDEALALWKCILSGPETPSLSSTEQTVFSLQLLGSLYRLMGKPLKSIESFQLACHLSHSLRDNIREVGALCQLTRLLFYLNSPQHAQITLQEAERILQSADRNNESYTLYELSCQLLHSQLYRYTDQFKDGVELLLGLLQHPALQKSSKAWYLLKVQVLQELSAFLSLPSACLLPDLQKQLYTYGWHNPETALTDAHKLLRSIVLLLLGNEVLSSPKGSSEVRFVDNGENLLLKWQVLADLLSCSQDLVSTLCRMGSVSEAKSFCLEGLKVAKSLQSIRHCADFLVRKAELETLRSETQLCEDDLQYVVFLMESCTDFTAKSQQKEVKVKKLSKGTMSTKKGKIADTPPSPPKEDFIKGMALQYVDTRDALIAPDSPSSVPYPEKTLPHFISHTLDCTCPLCSDLMLSLLCTRWLVAQAENDSQSYGLLSLALQRCQSISQRFSEILQKLFFKEDSKPVALGVADDLVARVYLAMSSLSPPTKLLDETLENGLSFLSSRQDSFPKHWKAGLLLAKTMKFIYKLSSKYSGSVADLFVQLWSWQPQFGSKNDNKSRAPSKSALGKKVFLTTPTDLQAPVCLVGSVDTPIFSSRPQTTPNQKYRPSTQSRSVIPTLTTKSTFMVYNEESPVPTVQPRAPRGRKTRTVLKVVFSDSDLDVPDDPDDNSAPNCKKNTARAKSGEQRRNARRANLMQTAQDSEDEERKGKSKPRRGRPSTKKAPEERHSPVSQRRSRRVKMEAACEEVEVLRAIIEEPEEILNLSIDELRGSDTEEKNVNKAHQKVQKPLRKEKTVTACDVLRRDAGVEQGNWTNGIKERAIDLNPFSITGLSSPMAATLSSLNLHSVSSLLHEALESVSHFPPCVLYSRLCHLLALFTGDKDPYNTALLVSESVSVTLRHHLLSDIHRKMRKLRKEGTGDMCDRFQRLTISDNKDPRIQYLVELEELFHFPAQAFDTQRFKEQLKRMPANTVACVLTLADSQLGSPGDTLLLTRLEKDNPPVTVQIPTAHLKVSLSAALHEFDEIQKQQKAINNLTDKKEWWDGRMGLDGRMKALIGLLEEHILGCWKVLMMPPCLDPAVSEEANKLLELSECDWGKVNSTLLKTVLGGSHHLTPQLISSLIQGFNLSQPERAQELLQKAVERLESSTSNTKGHLVLILDKHLQKLPWESTPCLLLRSVTRLPSLHFLLSYNLRTKYQPQSTLVQGVDPKQTFYVLNPHSNLPGTEERFREWFQNEPGWKGVIRSPPKSEQLQYAITKQDLYIYVGHGAGAHFLDVQTLQRLDCNAVVLLFGCSSAALAVRGDLEGAGIVLKYLLAGCPLVLGNLWDVTDREIDRYTVAFLQGWLKAGPGAPLLKFLSESRQAPKLKYIIGAAPVAYGLPVNLQ
ncbi:separin [Bombina bombina]|uniref:separin n=1 Tax=Bombina bombina TaxID=8345 RepID=UPI00235AB36C|nr:separin [Bombina bombina]